MGVVFAAAQENPVALGTRCIEGRELAEERTSREVPVAAQIQLQNVAFEKARRVLQQCNVDASDLTTRQGFGALMGMDRMCRQGKPIVDLSMRDALPTLGHHVPGKAVRPLERHFGAGPELSNAGEEDRIACVLGLDPEPQSHRTDDVHVLRNRPLETKTAAR